MCMYVTECMSLFAACLYTTHWYVWCVEMLLSAEYTHLHAICMHVQFSQRCIMTQTHVAESLPAAMFQHNRRAAPAEGLLSYPLCLSIEVNLHQIDLFPFRTISSWLPMSLTLREPEYHQLLLKSVRDR